MTLAEYRRVLAAIGNFMVELQQNNELSKTSWVDYFRKISKAPTPRYYSSLE